MIKSINNRLGFPWEEVIVLFVTIIGFRLISVRLGSSVIIWVIYDQIPLLLVILFAYLKRNGLIRFSSFKIEFRSFYRYMLFLMIVTGFVCISYSIASIIITAPALFQLDLINDITHNFSIWFYFKGLILAPLIEEFLFRGIILNVFLNRYSPAKAIIITTILFSVMHLNPMQYLVTFLLGMLLGWYYYKTRNLLTCIIVHSFSNLIGLTILKYFVDRLHNKFISSSTQVIQIDNVGLVILLSVSLIFVGFFYLFKSLILDPSNE